MDRQIIFRGKCINTGKWLYGYYFRSWDKAYILHGTINGAPDMKEVDITTVGQFTGYTDKHGKEIYEGDNLIGEKDSGTFLKRYVGHVEWVFYHCRYVIRCDNGILQFNALKNIRKNPNRMLCQFEITGNIHDK